jgi:hypothetical protein
MKKQVPVASSRRFLAAIIGASASGRPDASPRVSAFKRRERARHRRTREADDIIVQVERRTPSERARRCGGPHDAAQIYAQRLVDRRNRGDEQPGCRPRRAALR